MDVLYELEKAYTIATTGRQGPVLIDIPDNLQREYVDLSLCRKYSLSIEKSKDTLGEFESKLGEIIRMINNSKRPIIIAGWGVHLSQSEHFIKKFAELFGIPIVTTWAMIDLVDHKHPLYVGTFGTHGQRHTNFAVQNSDLIIALGTRLDSKATGTPVNSFARDSQKIMVDVDKAELDKFDKLSVKIDLKINDDLKDIKKINLDNLNLSKQSGFKDWIQKIKVWREKFYFKDQKYQQTEAETINPYKFFSILSKAIHKNTNIIFDTGCSLAWGMQGFSCKKNIRIYHDFNNTAMGWALPASIGSHFGSKDSDTICITGDGSFMMSIQELAVIKKHNIPVKIFLFNNSGYSMIQQTQEQWLDSNYFASSIEGGLDFPEYQNISEAFNLEYVTIKDDVNLENKISEVLDSKQATLCNVVISPKMRVTPQVKAGRPNEDMEPLLSEQELRDEMIIRTI